MLKVALAGNPNCGKTTLFNGLTGATAHVGNWPGVTVDRREGVYKKCKEHIAVVDLPGIYSLSPYTPEEVIARNFIVDETPDCVVNIVDATNLERNLYLTSQILETDVPVVVALNMIDEVERQGDEVNAEIISKSFGVPVVKISALKGRGLKELMDAVYAECGKKRKGTTVLKDFPVYRAVEPLKEELEKAEVKSPLFHAVKILENDEEEVKKFPEAAKSAEALKAEFADKDTDFEAEIADGRYKYITANCSSAVKYKNEDRFSLSRSDKADKVLTHKIWGIPIFLVILFAIFHLTFSEDFLYLGAIFKLPTLEELGYDTESYGVRWLATIYDGAIMSPGVIINNIWNDMLVGELFSAIQSGIEQIGMSSWVTGLINNGVLDGLSSVLSFLPPILVLFMFFSILEDSGYMARIAFILDRAFRRFGLSGRAFMPMIMGFGCSVPAMMNTRTLADEKEKVATVRVIPFFSCGAKLPILTAVAGGIVASTMGNAELITYGMYLLGIVTAIICVLLMRSTSLKGETPPFIMELPAYHAPQFKNLVLHLWDKVKHFIKKAFTIILASTIVIWVLTHFSFSWGFLEDEEINESILAGLSKLIQPIFTPLGFGSQLTEFGWVFAVAVVAGLIAKENVITTFSTLAACLMVVANMQFGELDVESGVDAVQAMAIATQISWPGLLAFIAFNMTTIPCFAAVGTAKGELGTKRFKWTLLFWLVASYVVGSAVYTIFSWWWTLFIWLAVTAGVTTLIVLKNKGKIKLPQIKRKRKVKSGCGCCGDCSHCSDSHQN